MAGRVRPRPFRILLPAVLVAPLLLATSPVRANHQPGSTYQGQAAGGTLMLEADGTMLNATATDLGGNTSCDASASGIQIMPDHTFFHTDPNWRIQGNFPSVSNAAGALQMDAPCIVPISGFDIPKLLKPCKCKDVDIKVRPRKTGFLKVQDQVNKVRVYTFVVEKTIKCEGDTGGCLVTAKVGIDGDRGTIPKKDRKADCSSDECPPEYKKKFEFDLKFEGKDYDWLRKGKRTIRGRVMVKCDEATITQPLVFKLNEGVYDKGDSDLGG